MRMHNPSHPGPVLREYLGELSVTEAASRLGVTRAALSRILNGSAGISADMALRLRDALGTSAEMWINMQSHYDLWQAEQKTKAQSAVLPWPPPMPEPRRAKIGSKIAVSHMLCQPDICPISSSLLLSHQASGSLS